MAFVPIPVEGAVDASIINRIQSAVAKEFAAMSSPDGIGITPINSSKQLTTYQVQSGDRYVVVDATGGNITIALPGPGNQQIVTVIKADTSKNTITVTYPKGPSLKVSTSITLLNTGTSWQVL